VYFAFLNLFLGESNVYTLGNIGYHRVVSTKLPSVGSTREASIAGKPMINSRMKFLLNTHMFI
jgi:hypothetical protein